MQSIKYLIALLLPLALSVLSCKTTQTATQTQLKVDSVGNRQINTGTANHTSTLDRTITLDSLEMIIRQINFSPPDSVGRVVPTTYTVKHLYSGHRQDNNIQSASHDSTAIALSEKTDMNKKTIDKSKVKNRDDTPIAIVVISLFFLIAILLLIRNLLNR